MTEHMKLFCMQKFTLLIIKAVHNYYKKILKQKAKVEKQGDSKDGYMHVQIISHAHVCASF